MVFRQADNQIKRRGMLSDGAAKGSKEGVFRSKAGRDEHRLKKRLYCNAVCADRISERGFDKIFDICFPIDFHTGFLMHVFYCAFSLPACPLFVRPRRRITAEAVQSERWATPVKHDANLYRIDDKLYRSEQPVAEDGEAYCRCIQSASTCAFSTATMTTI